MGKIVLSFLLFASMVFSMKLIVVTDIDYPPFTYIDQEGKLVGISPKLWELFAERTGIEIELIPMKWEDAIKAAREGKTDVIDLIFVTEERKKFLDYSIEIYKLTSSIYYHERLPALKTLRDLTPYVVGVKKGDALYDIARNSNPSIQFRFYDTYAELFLAMKNHEVEVILIDDVPAQYYLQKFDMVYNVKKSEPFTENSLHWAVPKGKEYTLALLNKGLEKISPKEIKNIVLSMLPHARIDPSFILTIVLVIMTLVAALLFFFILSFYLKRAVQKATRELDRKNQQLSSYNEELEAQSQEIKAMNEELERTLSELERTNNNFLSTLTLIDAAFNLQESGETFLSKAFNLVFDMFPQSHCGYIGLFQQQTWRVIEARGFDKDSINALQIPSSELYKPDVPLIVKDMRSLESRLMNERNLAEVEKILPKSSCTMIIPMKIMDQTIGNVVLEVKEGSGKMFTEHDLKMAESLAKIITSFFLVRRYIDVKEKLNREIVSMLVKALEYYDKYTQGHSERVARLCRKMAQRIGLPESELELAALLHDVGKIYVPQSILNKEGHLNDHEFELVKQHPVKGYELVSSIDGMERIAKIILYHHERYDGNGYPIGLRDAEIPLESQIIFISDSFDAMTTTRPYRKTPMSVKQAIEEIKRCSGTQFDPNLAEVFIELVDSNTATNL